MSYAQLRTPNPNIKCTPGYCLVYVQETFGIPAKIPTALNAWNTSTALNHPNDTNWKAAGSVPIFFSVNGNADGHVALGMKDGSIYSSSSPTSTTPVHHASLAAMEEYWGHGTMLHYLGWSEELEGVRVVQPEIQKPAPVTHVSPTQGAHKGVATVLVDALNVRASASTAAAIVATYKKGQKFNYDSWVIANGFVWLSYIGGSGKRRYVAEGPYNGNSKDVFVSGGVG